MAWNAAISIQFHLYYLIIGQLDYCKYRLISGCK